MRFPQSRPHPIRGALAALLACAATALAAGCGSSGTTATPTAAGHVAATAPASAPAVQVAYRNIAISPARLRVKVGSTIHWTNYDALEHNVTSVSGPQRFASGPIGEGGGFQITVLRPGVIRYRCTIHPSTMNGTIEVLR